MNMNNKYELKISMDNGKTWNPLIKVIDAPFLHMDSQYEDLHISTTKKRSFNLNMKLDEETYNNLRYIVAKQEAKEQYWEMCKQRFINELKSQVRSLYYNKFRR